MKTPKRPGKAPIVVHHAIRRVGNFTKDFNSFDASKIELRNPSREVTETGGLQFLYMEMPQKEFVAVGVEREKPAGRWIVLRAPVLLISERHVDGKGFFEDPLVGDDSAMRLLVDMIIANPEHRDALGRLLVRRLGVSRASAPPAGR